MSATGPAAIIVLRIGELTGRRTIATGAMTSSAMQVVVAHLSGELVGSDVERDVVDARAGLRSMSFVRPLTTVPRLPASEPIDVRMDVQILRTRRRRDELAGHVTFDRVHVQTRQRPPLVAASALPAAMEA